MRIGLREKAKNMLSIAIYC